MKLISISSWQRHLFRREAINWSAVGIQASAGRIFEKYRLSPMVPSMASAALDPAGRLATISGAGGEFKLRGSQHTIEQLIVDPVSVQFQVTGETEAANAFYEDLLLTIEEAGQTKIDRGERLTMTLVTLAVAKMEVDPWKFLSKEWTSFLNHELEPLVKVPNATHKFWPQTFTTSVVYKTEQTDFVLTPKPFTIEPRGGTTPEQGIFFVQSPTDSKTHLGLMDKLENIFRKSE